jgi:hypothetical protein
VSLIRNDINLSAKLSKFMQLILTITNIVSMEMGVASTVVGSKIILNYVRATRHNWTKMDNLCSSDIN